MSDYDFSDHEAYAAFLPFNPPLRDYHAAEEGREVWNDELDQYRKAMNSTE